MPILSVTKRCGWVNLNNPEYVKYHDEEWGVPVRDDNILFEFLILEGAQAGLSWETVLKKRDAYRAAFFNYDLNKLSNLTDSELEEILMNPNIIRNRLKVFSVRRNAVAFIEIQKEFGSFDKYIWSYVGNKPLVNLPKNLKDIKSKTEISDRISKDLKKRGMNFVGSTIIYAYMQAVGLVNDHTVDCFRSAKD